MPCRTHWVSAVVMIEVVVVGVACNESIKAAGQGSADPIGSGADQPGSRGLVAY